jgi:hypothetical protein
VDAGDSKPQLRGNCVGAERVEHDR